MTDRPKHLNIGDPILWTIVIIDTVGEPLDAEADPTVSIRKNGSLIGDSVTVTKRAATTGLYDCLYQPAITPLEGDQFTVQEFVQVDVGAGVTSHEYPWEFITNNVCPDGGGLRQVSGIVQDSDLTLVAGATVEVLDSGGSSLGFFNTTNTLGEFNFNLDDGPYIFLIAALPGYQTDTGTAYTVSVSQTTPLLTLNLLVDEEDPVDPDAIDLSGIKKVKTKHMEIEAFDPRIMQDVRDRELPPPNFCDLEMCRGVSVKRYNSSYRRGCY